MRLGLVLTVLLFVGCGLKGSPGSDVKSVEKTRPVVHSPKEGEPDALPKLPETSDKTTDSKNFQLAPLTALDEPETFRSLQILIEKIEVRFPPFGLQLRRLILENARSFTGSILAAPKDMAFLGDMTYELLRAPKVLHDSTGLLVSKLAFEKMSTKEKSVALLQAAVEHLMLLDPLDRRYCETYETDLAACARLQENTSFQGRRSNPGSAGVVQFMLNAQQDEYLSPDILGRSLDSIGLKLPYLRLAELSATEQRELFRRVSNLPMKAGDAVCIFEYADEVPDVLKLSIGDRKERLNLKGLPDSVKSTQPLDAPDKFMWALSGEALAAQVSILLEAEGGDLIGADVVLSTYDAATATMKPENFSCRRGN